MKGVEILFPKYLEPTFQKILSSDGQSRRYGKVFSIVIFELATLMNLTLKWHKKEVTVLQLLANEVEELWIHALFTRVGL